VTESQKNSIFQPKGNKSGLSRTTISEEQLLRYKDSAFFKTIGTNGRNCVSCHQADQGWTITPEKVQQRLRTTNGKDPIFTADGSNCKETGPRTLSQMQKDYSLLLSKALIRVDIKIPVNAEFSLINVDDPYHCASKEEISMYRRPLPTTNLRFLTGVMWDARESSKEMTLRESLLQQAKDATMGHAQASKAPSQEELESIVDFEMALHSAQSFDFKAKSLETGTEAGPLKLSTQEFFVGINDPLNPTENFVSNAMNLFPNWSPVAMYSNPVEVARASIARGQVIFATKTFDVKGVNGLNDVVQRDSLKVTCTTCHNSPAIGNHSVPFPVDLGLADESRRTPDMPLYTFQCQDGKIVKTTDPGRAMITGKCKDFNKMKGPVLRALASRAPYFHNGSAASIEKVIEFYNSRFSIKFTKQEKTDLAAFLKTL
jgi:hypothetical protein